MSPAFIDNDGRLNWRKIGYHARSTFAVLLAIAVLGGGGWFVYTKANDAYIEWRTQDDYTGEGTEAVEVLIPPGGPTPTQIGDLLTEAGVVKSTKTFRKVAIESGRWSELKAGRYKVKKQLPSEAALDMILDPKNLVVLDVLFQEGTTLAEQQQIILKKDKLDVKEDALMAAYDGTKYSNLPDYAGGKLEGFLFPAKYQVAEPEDGRVFSNLLLNHRLRDRWIILETYFLWLEYLGHILDSYLVKSLSTEPFLPLCDEQNRKCDHSHSFSARDFHPAFCRDQNVR